MARVVKENNEWLVTSDSGDLIESFEGTLVGRRKARLFARGLAETVDTPKSEPIKRKSEKGKKAGGKKKKKK